MAYLADSFHLTDPVAPVCTVTAMMGELLEIEAQRDELWPEFEALTKRLGEQAPRVKAMGEKADRLAYKAWSLEGAIMRAPAASPAELSAQLGLMLKSVREIDYYANDFAGFQVLEAAIHHLQQGV